MSKKVELSPEALQAVRFEQLITDILQDAPDANRKISSDNADKMLDKILSASSGDIKNVSNNVKSFVGNISRFDDGITATSDRTAAQRVSADRINAGQGSRFDQLSYDYYRNSQGDHDGLNAKTLKNEIAEYFRTDFKTDLANYIEHRDEINGIHLSDVDIPQPDIQTAVETTQMPVSDTVESTILTEPPQDTTTVNEPSESKETVEPSVSESKDSKDEAIETKQDQSPSVTIDGKQYTLETERLEGKNGFVGYHCSLETEDHQKKDFVVDQRGMVAGSNAQGIEYGQNVSSSITGLSFEEKGKDTRHAALSAFDRSVIPDRATVTDIKRTASFIDKNQGVFKDSTPEVKSLSERAGQVAKVDFSARPEYPQDKTDKTAHAQYSKDYFNAIIEKQEAVSFGTEVKGRGMEQTAKEYLAAEKGFDTKVSAPTLDVDKINTRLDAIESKLSTYGNDSRTDSVRQEIGALRDKVVAQAGYQQEGQVIKESGTHEQKVEWASRPAPMTTEEIKGLQAYADNRTDKKPNPDIEKIQSGFQEISNPNVEKARGTLDVTSKNITTIQNAGVSTPALDKTQSVIEQKQAEIKTPEHAGAIDYSSKIGRNSEATFNGISVSNAGSVRSATLPDGKGGTISGVVQPLTERETVKDKGGTEKTQWQTKGYLVTIPGEKRDGPTDKILVGTDNKVVASTTDRFQPGADLGVNIQDKRDHAVSLPEGRTVLDVYSSKVDFGTKGASDIIKSDTGKTMEAIVESRSAFAPDSSTLNTADKFHSAAETYRSIDTKSGTDQERFGAILEKAQAGEQVVSLGKDIDTVRSDPKLAEVQQDLQQYKDKLEQEKGKLSGIEQRVDKVSTALDHYESRIPQISTPFESTTITRDIDQNGRQPLQKISADIQAQKDYIAQGEACQTYDEKKAWLDSSSPVTQGFEDRVQQVEQYKEGLDKDHPNIAKESTYFDKEGNFAIASSGKVDWQAARSEIRQARDISPTIGFKDGLDTTRRQPSVTTQINGEQYKDVKISMVLEKDDKGKPISEQFIVDRQDKYGNHGFYGADGQRFAEIVRDSDHFKMPERYGIGTDDQLGLTRQTEVHGKVNAGETTYDKVNSDIVKDAYSRGIDQADKACNQLEGGIVTADNAFNSTYDRIEIMHNAGVLDDKQYTEQKSEALDRRVEFETSIKDTWQEYRANIDDAKSVFNNPDSSAADKIKAAYSVADTDKFQSPVLRQSIMEARPLTQLDIDKGRPCDKQGNPSSFESGIKSNYDANIDRITAYKDSASKDEKDKISDLSTQNKYQAKYEAALQRFEQYADKTDFSKFSSKGWHQFELDYYSYKGQIAKPDGRIASAADVNRDRAVLLNDVSSGRFLAEVIGEHILGDPVTFDKEGNPIETDKKGNIHPISAEEYKERKIAFETARNNYIKFMGGTNDSTQSDTKSPYSDFKMSVVQEEKLGYNALHKLDLACAAYKCGIAVDSKGNIVEGATPSKEAVVSAFIQALNADPIVIIYEYIMMRIEKGVEHKEQADKIEKKEDTPDKIESSSHDNTIADVSLLEATSQDGDNVVQGQNFKGQDSTEDKDQTDMDQTKQDSKADSSDGTDHEIEPLVEDVDGVDNGEGEEYDGRFDNIDPDDFIITDDDGDEEEDDSRFDNIKGPEDLLGENDTEDEEVVVSNISEQRIDLSESIWENEPSEVSTDNKQQTESAVGAEDKQQQTESAVGTEDKPQSDAAVGTENKHQTESAVGAEDKQQTESAVGAEDKQQQAESAVGTEDKPQSDAAVGTENKHQTESAVGAEDKQQQTESAVGAEDKQQQTESAVGAEDKQQQAESAVGAEDKQQQAESAVGAEDKQQQAESAVGAEDKQQQAESAVGAEDKQQQAESAVGAEDKQQQAESAVGTEDKPQSDAAVGTENKHQTESAVGAEDKQQQAESAVGADSDVVIDVDNSNKGENKENDHQNNISEVTIGIGDKYENATQQKEDRYVESDDNDHDPIGSADNTKMSMADMASSAKGEHSTTSAEEKTEEDKKKDKISDEEKEKENGVSIDDLKEAMDTVLDNGGIEGTNFDEIASSVLDTLASVESVQDLKQDLSEYIADKYQEAFQSDEETKQDAVEQVAQLENYLDDKFSALEDTHLSDIQQEDISKEMSPDTIHTSVSEPQETILDDNNGMNLQDVTSDTMMPEDYSQQVQTQEESQLSSNTFEPSTNFSDMVTDQLESQNVSIEDMDLRTIQLEQQIPSTEMEQWTIDNQPNNGAITTDDTLRNFVDSYGENNGEKEQIFDKIKDSISNAEQNKHSNQDQKSDSSNSIKSDDFYKLAEDFKSDDTLTPGIRDTLSNVFEAAGKFTELGEEMGQGSLPSIQEIFNHIDNVFDEIQNEADPLQSVEMPKVDGVDTNDDTNMMFSYENSVADPILNTSFDETTTNPDTPIMDTTTPELTYSDPIDTNDINQDSSDGFPEDSMNFDEQPDSMVDNTPDTSDDSTAIMDQNNSTTDNNNDNKDLDNGDDNADNANDVDAEDASDAAEFIG